MTVTDPVDMEVMLSEAGESAAVMAGAGVTWTVTADCPVMPSPVATIRRLALAAVAVAAALRVSVTVWLPEVAVNEAGLQLAVTPAGRVGILSATLPANEPPVVTVTWSVPLAPPATRESEAAAGVTVRVGNTCVTVSARDLVAV